MRPDLVSLQECMSAEPLAGLSDECDFVGAAKSEHSAFVHLYARPKLKVARVRMDAGVPGVLGVFESGGVEVHVAALHLVNGREAAAARLRRLKALRAAVSSSSQALLNMGDLNVYGDDEEELLAATKMEDATYRGSSWDPRVNRFYANQE